MIIMSRDRYGNVKKHGFVRLGRNCFFRVYLTPKWVIHETDLMRLMNKLLPNHIFTAKVWERFLGMILDFFKLKKFQASATKPYFHIHKVEVDNKLCICVILYIWHNFLFISFKNMHTLFKYTARDEIFPHIFMPLFWESKLCCVIKNK